MDNNSKSATTTNFGAVWQRVCGTGSAAQNSSLSQAVDTASASKPVTDRETGRLLMFIKSEIYLIKTYSTLYRHSSGQLRNSVRQLQNMSRARLKSLRSAYFLITGSCASPQVEIECFVSPIRTLRSAYLAENSAETAYLSAAEQTGYPSLSRMYTAMSQSAGKNGKNIIPLAGLLYPQH